MIEQYGREAIKKGKRKVHTDIVMIQIMEQMQWSYEDYMNTPERIIDLILRKSEIDYKVSQLKNGK